MLPIVIMGSMVNIMPGSRTVVRGALVVVRHLRRAVEHLADAVADERPHHEEAGGVGVGLDGAADVGERRARSHRLDARGRGTPR